MKITKKILSLLLVFIMGISPISCKNETPQINNNHMSSIEKTDDWIVKNGFSDYKILIENDADELIQFAANELNFFLKNTAGCELLIQSSSNDITPKNGKFISIGETNILSQKDKSAWTQNLGDDGYIIRTIDDDIYLLGGSDYGSMYAVYDFADKVLNAKVYAHDEIVINPNKNIGFVNMNVREIPDISRRAISSFYVSNSSFLRRRFRLKSNSENWQYWTHSHFAFVPKDVYYNDHKDWYSADGKQLCLTNEDMTNEMIKNIILFLEENPNEKYVTIGQQDSYTFCTCPKCTEQVQKIRESGVMVRFVNKVARGVQKHFDDNGSGRKIQFATYAYQKTQFPPVKIENDKYVPLDDSVHLDDNIGVIIAPLSACYNHPILDNKYNSIARQTIQGWNALGSKIYIRFYSAQYYNYFVPYIYYGNLATNYKQVKENNAQYIFDTAVGESGTSGFQEMLAYIQSQLLWNNSLNVNELKDDFMKVFYKDGYEYMKELFRLIEIQWARLEKEGMDFYVSGSLGSDYVDKKVFPFEYLKQQEILINKAMDSISRWETQDKEVYNKLKNRIMTEYTSVLYWQLTFYADHYDNEALSSKIDLLETICNTVGIDRWAEYNPSLGQDKSITTLVAEMRLNLL